MAQRGEKDDSVEGERKEAERENDTYEKEDKEERSGANLWCSKIVVNLTAENPC